MTKLVKYFPINFAKLDDFIEKSNTKHNSEYILVFDIDDTIYKMTNEMYKEEKRLWETFYNKRKRQLVSIPDFDSALNFSKMYGEGIYKYLDITAKQAEVERGEIKFEKYVMPDNNLKKLLMSLPFSKWCFTNGIRIRAEQILKASYLEDVFEGVICFDDEAKGETGKPYDCSYEFVEKLLNIKNPEKIIFFDDSIHNIKTGQKRGWTCYHVNRSENISELILKALEDTKK